MPPDDRAATLEMLAGERSWPPTTLTLRRDRGGWFETGYARRGAPLVILTEHGLTRERRYVSAEDVVNDGWRADAASGEEAV
jgi:hypothetical protein